MVRPPMLNRAEVLFFRSAATRLMKTNQFPLTGRKKTPRKIAAF
jgi:hypothetical protein